MKFGRPVLAVDPEGKAIVITVGKGESALDVGTIVDSNTKLIVDGKSAPIGDLTKEVKPGDTVVLNYVMTGDLYAKKIIKK